MRISNLRSWSICLLLLVEVRNPFAGVTVRKASQATPGPVYTSIMAAMDAAAPGDEVFVDAMDGCEAVTLTKRITLIGTGDLDQSDWVPGRSCMSSLRFDKRSVGSFVKGFVIQGSVIGDSNFSIKISNCHIHGDVSIQADTAGYVYVESVVSDGGEDFGINSLVDIGHNVIEGNVDFPGHTHKYPRLVRDNVYDTIYVDQPGDRSFTHNNIVKGTIYSNGECNGDAAAVTGCGAYPWPVWGPDSLRYVAKPPRAYLRRADLEKAIVTEGEQLRVRFQGLMAPP